MEVTWTEGAGFGLGRRESETQGGRSPTAVPGSGRRDDQRTGAVFGPRLGGNEVAHEAQFSEPAAVLLDSHFEQLVVYLFTVPEVKAKATG